MNTVPGVFVDDVNLSYFTSNFAVGSAGGGHFSINTDVAELNVTSWVSSLTFWCDHTCMRGCVMQLNGETNSVTIGHQDGNKSQTFIFGDGEKLTSLKVWYKSASKAGRLGGVEWTTSENRSFAFGYQDGDPYSPDLGSGVLVGVFGSAGDDIDSFGFAILRSIKTTRLINLTYPNLDSAQVQSAPMSIKTIKYDNSRGSVEQQFTFSGEMETTNTSTWSVTTSVTLGVSFEVEGKVPLFGSATATTSLELSVSGTYESSKTTSTTESFSFPLNVPAGKVIKATATLFEVNITVPYTATMVYTLDTGKEMKFDIDGKYEGVDSDRVEVTVEEDKK